MCPKCFKIRIKCAQKGVTRIKKYGSSVSPLNKVWFYQKKVCTKCENGPKKCLPPTLLPHLAHFAHFLGKCGWSNPPMRPLPTTTAEHGMVSPISLGMRAADFVPFFLRLATGVLTSSSDERTRIPQRTQASSFRRSPNQTWRLLLQSLSACLCRQREHAKRP